MISKSLIVLMAFVQLHADMPQDTPFERFDYIDHRILKVFDDPRASTGRVMTNNVFIGYDAGIGTVGSRNMLIGDCTTTPAPETSNFVNLFNEMCGDIDTLEELPCPPPLRGCKP